MKRETIGSREFIYLGILYLAANPSMTCVFRMAGQDTWISALIGAAAAVPLVLMYARIASLYPGLGLFDIIFEVMGKFFGWIFALLMFIYAAALCGLTIREFCEFIQVLALPKTPQLVIAVIVALLCAWIVRYGVENLARCSPLLFTVMLAILVAVSLMIAPQLKWEYLLPVGRSSPNDIGITAFAFLVYPLGESVLLLCLCGNLKESEKRGKIFLISLLATVGILISIMLRNILALGVPSYIAQYFPSYISTSMINVGDFLQRIEALITITAVVCIITKVSICIYAGCLGLARLTGSREYKPFAFPLALVIAVWAVLLFHNTMELFMTLFLSLFAAPFFQAALPLLLWVTAEIRTAGAHDKMQENSS